MRTHLRRDGSDPPSLPDVERGQPIMVFSSSDRSMRASHGTSAILDDHGSIPRIIVPGDETRRLLLALEVVECALDFADRECPGQWIRIPLAIVQVIVLFGVGRPVVIRVTRAESGIATLAEVHQPATLAVDQGAQGLTVVQFDPDLAVFRPID